MNLSTKINQQPLAFQLIPESKVMTIGSCFSVHIGNKLHEAGIQTLVNPFGTIFNPASIANALQRIIENRNVAIDEISYHEERHFHYDFHTSFDHTDADSVAKNINASIKSSAAFLKEVDVLIITLGTSYVYELLSESRIVANCHKVPNDNFKKRLLTIEESSNALQQAESSLHKINPSCRIIYTVSPVRHTKDGIVENSRSKARLIETCHSLTEDAPSNHYFPSFEIMMDELRDYRFYAKDLIHPSDTAVEIIWEYFKSSFLSTEALSMENEVLKIRAEASHRPFNPASDAHKQFLQKHQEKRATVLSKYPWIDI